MFFGEELPWQHFIKLNNIRKLPLREQKEYYNRYLNNLSTQRMWAQIGAAAGGGSTSTPAVPQALRLLFSDIAAVDAIVGDSTNVEDWNTYFDLPTYGSPFTSVSVTGDEVKLYDGSSITIKESLFDQADELGTYLLEVDDQAGSIIEVEYDAFGWDNNAGCLNITTINLPALVIAGDYAFSYCGRDGGLLTTISLPLLTTVGTGCFSVMNTLTSINLPSCVNLGPTVGNDFVFFNMIGNTITLTVPSALMTADAGNPDGDIAYLQANNTVTIVTI